MLSKAGGTKGRTTAEAMHDEARKRVFLDAGLTGASTEKNLIDRSGQRRTRLSGDIPSLDQRSSQ